MQPAKDSREVYSLQDGVGQGTGAFLLLIYQELLLKLPHADIVHEVVKENHLREMILWRQ